MSAQSIATRPEALSHLPLHTSFMGIVRGEFLKIARLFRLLLLLLTLFFVVGFLLGASQPTLKADLQHAPLHFLYYSLESNLVIFRIFAGIFLLILASFVIGREYQYGTIRILLARGVGRMQLLLAKMVLLALIALVLLVTFTLLIALFTCIQMLFLVGNVNALNVLTAAFWLHAGIDLLTVLISMGATILLAAAMNALGRSLTFGLSASLVWFPIDNISAVLLNKIAELAHNDFWRQVTIYLLGPLLNRLPGMLLPVEARSGFESFGAGPLFVVSGAHALWVIGVYALIFLLVALLVTWKRDVKE